jgi:hypothetical protein
LGSFSGSGGLLSCRALEELMSVHSPELRDVSGK